MFKINCSIGEIIDKVTILKLKYEHTDEISKTRHIEHELELLYSEVPLCRETNILFEDLYSINYTLWILEDLIREKSKNKQFDREYINYSELIHIVNDIRYNTKRQINEFYGSEIREVKIYSKTTTKENDMLLLYFGKMMYTSGEYMKSFHIIVPLMRRYNNKNYDNTIVIDLIYSYCNIMSILNLQDEFGTLYKMENIINNFKDIDFPQTLKKHCKTLYTIECLKNMDYKKAYNVLNCYSSITGPGINYDNMDFFKTSDTGKNLLIYTGGGLGDDMMMSRLIPELCKKFENNKIIYLVHDRLSWIFRNIFSSLKNLDIVDASKAPTIEHIDYHCSLFCLIKYLNIVYDTIYFSPQFVNLDNFKNRELEKISTNNKNYVFNWKGNIQNTHEKTNRCMDLNIAEQIFKLDNVTWHIITQDLTEEEQCILKKYNNVKCYRNIDLGKNAFEESISILKSVDAIFSTDTSLVHLSANLNVKTYVLLTLGCEWRWTRKNSTRWYPDAILLRQSTFGCWKNVVSDIINIVKE